MNQPSKAVRFQGPTLAAVRVVGDEMKAAARAHSDPIEDVAASVVQAVGTGDGEVEKIQTWMRIDLAAQLAALVGAPARDRAIGGDGDVGRVAVLVVPPEVAGRRRQARGVL